MLASALIAIPLAVILGSVGAVRRDRAFDHTSQAVLLVLTALPEFVIGLVLLILFGTTVFKLLPAVALIPSGGSAFTHPRELALPVITLVLAVLPYLTRLQRAAMIDVLESDYIQMARLKGLPEHLVIRRHALRNSVVPVVQGSALTLIYLTGRHRRDRIPLRLPGLGQRTHDSRGRPRSPRRAGDRPAAGGRLRRRQPDRRSPHRPSRSAPSYSTNMSSTPLSIEQPRGAGRSGRMRTLARTLEYGRTRIGLGLLAFVILLAIVGPFVAPHAPDAVVGLPARSPSGSFPLGTDYLGHDVLSRILWGGRSVVWMAFAAATLGVGIGAAVGLLAAYTRTATDDVLMRGMDVILAFPQIVFVLLFVSLLGPKLGLIVVLVAISWVPQVARVIRGITSDIVHREYVESAELIGLPRRKILAREILPNVTTPLMVEYGLRLTWSIALIAAISFLGFGIQPPDADWGLMINENRNILSVQPWALIVPAACIAMFAIGTNFIAEGVARAIAGIDRKGGAR